MSAFSIACVITNVTPHSPKREAPLQKQPANAHKPAKTNTIDNQRVKCQNPKITGNKPAKPEMINKPNMTRNNPITESNTATTVTAYLNQQKHPTSKNEYH